MPLSRCTHVLQVLRSRSFTYNCSKAGPVQGFDNCRQWSTDDWTVAGQGTQMLGITLGNHCSGTQSIQASAPLAHLHPSEFCTGLSCYSLPPASQIIKIISYVVITFCYRKANILHRWSNILHIFNWNKGLFHCCRSHWLGWKLALLHAASEQLQY